MIPFKHYFVGVVGLCLLSLMTLMPIIEFTLLVITEEVKDVTNINISQDSLDQDVKAITFNNSTDETQSKVNETQLKVNETQSKVNETQTKVKVDIEVKKKEKYDKRSKEQTEKQVHCGCPDTCDWASLAYNRNEQHVCLSRIQYLMNRYNRSEEDACRGATKGDNAPCGQSCNPDVCQVYSWVDDEPTSRNVSLPAAYDVDQYAIEETKTLKPLIDEDAEGRSCTYQHRFWSGYCNELRMFLGVILSSTEEEHRCSRIDVNSIKWKDQFNTNNRVPHLKLWDVVHWNKYSPTLPRFASTDNSVDSHPVVWEKFSWLRKPTDVINFVQRAERLERNDAHLAIMKGALQPHPDIVQIINDFKISSKFSDNEGSMPYMVFHARVEPDMQKHFVCRPLKVLNITHIIESIYEKFKQPPVMNVLILFDRNVLEKEVKTKKDNILAAYNLNTINELKVSGMWDGRVKVHEAGSDLAINSKYPVLSKHSAIVGGIINFYLALEAKMFIGTPVSSYSSSVTSFRFYRGLKQNYFYVPEGLSWVTSPEMSSPPRFGC